jgi:hypothetical protein
MVPMRGPPEYRRNDSESIAKCGNSRNDDCYTLHTKSSLCVEEQRCINMIQGNLLS